MYFRRIFQKPLQYSVKCSCKAFTQVNRSGVLRAGFPSTHTKLGRRTNITWFWQGRVCQFAACVGAAHPLDTRHILSLCSIETVLTAKSGSGGEVWAQKTKTAKWSRAIDAGVWCVYRGNYRGKYRSQGLAQHWLFVVQTSRKNACT